MRLRQIRLYHYNRPFLFTIRTSHKTWTEADSVILALDFDDGVTGWGESAPRPYVTGESLNSVRQVCADILAPALFGLEIANESDIPAALKTAAGACERRAIGPWQSALGAVDIALFDALSRRAGPDALSLIGETARSDFPYSLSIPMAPLDLIQALFDELGLSRFRHLKVIMGPDKEENAARTRLLRRLFGTEADIRVEANGKWSFEQAIDMLSELKSCGLSAVEQPLAPGRLEETARLRRITGIPVVLDESVSNPEELRAAADAGAADIVNIKISKCGGLYRSGQIAACAGRRRLKCQLGAHIGESPILQWAGKVFALRTGNMVYFEGCSHLLYETLAGKPGEKEARGAFYGAGDAPPDPKEVLKHCRPLATLAKP